MRRIVKVFVVWTLGLAVLFGSPAVSLAAPLMKPPPFDPSSCTRTSVDTWRCVVDGKDCMCPSPSPQGCKCISLPSGTPGRQQAPVVKPQAPVDKLLAPGGKEMQTK
jgi:hypothetical protein